MACENCNDTPQSFPTYFSYDPQCNQPQSPCGGDAHDASCVIYTGAPLSCIGVGINDSLELALQKINTIICNTTNNGFPSYNYHCLTQDGPITSQGQFVDRITAKVCTLNTNFDTFVNTTFPTYQTTTNGRLTNLENPEIVCTSASVGVSDSLATVLSKYCNKFSNIDTNLDLSGVTWDQCFVVNNPPTTVKDGFQTVLSQICSLKTSGVTLPTFNNTGSCLPAPVTSNDSLVDTVNKIKTRLCQTATFTTTGINFGCVQTPATVTLDSTISAILAKVTQNSQNSILQVEGGTLAYIDNTNPCLGKKLTITGGGTSTDRLVSASPSDNTPGTLAEKLVAGDGVTIDTATDPTKANISTDGKILTNTTDGERGYLEDKITGNSTNEVTIDVASISGPDSNHLEISANIDVGLFLQKLALSFNADQDLRAQFCSLVSACGTEPTVYSNVYSAGPLGQDAAVSNLTFYSDSNISVNPLATGIRLYYDSDLTQPVLDGRYYIYNSAQATYTYFTSSNGALTSTTGNVSSLTVIGKTCTIFQDTDSGACATTSVSFTYPITYIGPIAAGVQVYTGYLFLTPVADGWYNYENGGNSYRFQVTSGAVVSNPVTCGVIDNGGLPVHNNCYFTSPNPD